MTDIPKTQNVSLVRQMQAVITAGAAVRKGIATHAEKHRAANEAAHHKAEAEQKLKAKP